MPTASLQRVRLLPIEFSGYDAKPSDSEVSVPEYWGMWSTPSLLLIVVPLRVPSIDRIKQFNYLPTHK